MSLLPEEFPVVLAIFMAMGAWRIAQVGVLTRRASAIESMGAATVLCTDKTGTLTQNRMVAAGLWMASGETADLGAGMASDRFDELLRYGDGECPDPRRSDGGGLTRSCRFEIGSAQV